MSDPIWLRPTTVAEAVALRAEYGDDALVVAGGTFIGVLLSTGFLDSPEAYIALRGIDALRGVEVSASELTLGALATHRSVELDEGVKAGGWAGLAETFGVVANVRIRTAATVGGVLADADYASDPPAMLCALDARAVLAGATSERELSIEELILGHYETAIAAEELLVRVRVPKPTAAAYLKFRSGGSEDRPCVGVAVARRAGRLRIVVGAVSDRPQFLPDVCAIADGAELSAELCDELAERYGRGIEASSDLRGSADYRRRVTRVLVRRALERVA